MVEPEDFADAKKHRYTCDGKEYSFAQLCCHFGLKYMAVWWKVAKNGMTVEQAIKTCINDPHSWGATYSDGSLAIMSEEERAEKMRIAHEKAKKTKAEKGLNNG